MTSNALALIAPEQYGVMEKLAKVATGSGYAGKTEIQAMFVMLKGFELGISPMQALDGITVIQNKTTVSPQLMLALINRSGELADIKITSDATRAEVTMTRKGRSPHVETFTMANATSMGLAGKDNWKKQPAVMLKWRAVSACARVVFPDVIQGMYTPEEMGAEVSEDDNGNVIIDAPVIEAQTPKPLHLGNVVDSIQETLNEMADEPLTVEIPTPAITTPEKPANVLKTPPSANSGQSTAVIDYAKVYPVVRGLYNSATHMQNSIAKLKEEGAFKSCTNESQVIARITEHKNGQAEGTSA